MSIDRDSQVEIFGRFIRDNGASRLVEVNDLEVFLPKSLIENWEIVDTQKRLFTCIIPQWLAIDRRID